MCWTQISMILLAFLTSFSSTYSANVTLQITKNHRKFCLFFVYKERKVAFCILLNGLEIWWTQMGQEGSTRFNPSRVSFEMLTCFKYGSSSRYNTWRQVLTRPELTWPDLTYLPPPEYLLATFSWKIFTWSAMIITGLVYDHIGVTLFWAENYNYNCISRYLTGVNFELSDFEFFFYHILEWLSIIPLHC